MTSPNTMGGDQCNDGAYAWLSCGLEAQVQAVQAVDGILLCTFYRSLSYGFSVVLPIGSVLHGLAMLQTAHGGYVSGLS